MLAMRRVALRPSLSIQMPSLQQIRILQFIKPSSPRNCNDHKYRQSQVTKVSVNAASHRKFVTVHINGHQRRLQLDTASDVTIISRSLWQSIGKPTLERVHHKVTSACGGTLNFKGRLSCCVSFNGKSAAATCFVADTDINLLGLDWIQLLELSDLPIRTICNQIQMSKQTPASTCDGASWPKRTTKHILRQSPIS